MLAVTCNGAGRNMGGINFFLMPFIFRLSWDAFELFLKPENNTRGFLFKENVRTKGKLGYEKTKAETGGRAGWYTEKGPCNYSKRFTV